MTASFEDIGAAMGISPIAACRLYYRAIHKIKDRIRDNPVYAAALHSYMEASPEVNFSGIEEVLRILLEIDMQNRGAMVTYDEPIDSDYTTTTTLQTGVRSLDFDNNEYIEIPTESYD